MSAVIEREWIVRGRNHPQHRPVKISPPPPLVWYPARFTATPQLRPQRSRGDRKDDERLSGSGIRTELPLSDGEGSVLSHPVAPRKCTTRRGGGREILTGRC